MLLTKCGWWVAACRMQLMVYKLLWDNLVTTGIPFDLFFHHFKLHPLHSLSGDVRAHAGDLYIGSNVQTLQDIVPLFSQECLLFPKAHELLLLRYCVSLTLLKFQFNMLFFLSFLLLYFTATNV
jgi:hypothetical protein